MHTMQLRRIIGYLQKLLYTVKRIRMSPTPTLNIYLFEGPIQLGTMRHPSTKRLDFNCSQCLPLDFSALIALNIICQFNYLCVK
jgi:hypothetical protein